MKQLPGDIIPFEKANFPLKSYSFIDNGNNDIIVNVPNPEKHTPHDVQNDPMIHYNVAYAIKNYDVKRAGSQGVAALVDDAGERTVYECYDFYEKIDHPKKYSHKNYSLIAVVHYGYDGNNYTTTYYDTPGGGGLL